MNPLTAVYFALARPIEWALRALTNAFDGVSVLKSIGSFGIAIVVVTLAIRLLLFPLFQWQLKAQRRIQAEQRLIAPQMAALRKKYKSDRTKLQAEMMQLYRDHNISPLGQFSGCLPIVIQIPIIGGLYNGIRDATNALHSTHFLWIGNLGQSSKDAAGGNLVDLLSHPQLLLIPAAAATLTFVQSKITMAPMRPDMSDQERQMYAASKNMVAIVPAMILVMGVIFYQGVTLYWVTQSTMMVAQQWWLLGWGGLRVPPWFPGARRLTPLSYSVAAQASLEALGSKARRPEATTRAGRSQVPTVPPKAGGARPKPTPRRPGGRVAPQTAGGPRRRRGR